MTIVVNGKPREEEEGISIARLLTKLQLHPLRVAVLVNQEIVRRPHYETTFLKEGDRVEIVTIMAGGARKEDVMEAGVLLLDQPLRLGGKEFRSRLIVGSSKYPDPVTMQRAWEASGAEIITVAVRRANLDNPQESLLNYIDLKKYTVLPNTAGCYTAEEAFKTALLAREFGLSEMIKLEVIGDERTLFPDTEGLIKATKMLVKEGFIVLPYTNDDPIVAKKLEDAGAAAVMPLGAPIGSGLGIRNPYNIKIILEMVRIPVIVDAGVGTASDATIAMELGCDGVLMNTGIACAKDPVKMATAMRYAVEAGRLAYLAGRIPKKLYASASTPLEGMPELL